MLPDNISRSSPYSRIPKYLHHKMLDMTWKNTIPKKAIPDKNKIILVLCRQSVLVFYLMEKIHEDQFFRLQWELQRVKQTQKASIINSTDCLLQLELVVSTKLYRLNFDDELFTRLSRTCSLLQC